MPVETEPKFLVATLFPPGETDYLPDVKLRDVDACVNVGLLARDQAIALGLEVEENFTGTRQYVVLVINRERDIIFASILPDKYVPPYTNDGHDRRPVRKQAGINYLVREHEDISCYDRSGE